MKRVHVHISVPDLPKAVAFYSTLFGAQPTKKKPDYAKWQLDDPRVNFAISARGAEPGLRHLGIEAESPEELSEAYARAESADSAMVNEGATTCCYAKSEKGWAKDPAGVSWEIFHTTGDADEFGAVIAQAAGASAGPAFALSSAPAAACCGPTAGKTSACS